MKPEIINDIERLPEGLVQKAPSFTPGNLTMFDDNGNLLDAGKQISINNISINLLASNWSGLSQTVAVDYAKSNNTIIVSPAVNSIELYSASGVYCSAQSDGNLTFTCNNVPTSDITVNVVIMG